MATVPVYDQLVPAPMDLIFQWWDDVQQKWESYSPPIQIQIQQHIRASQLPLSSLHRTSNLNISIPHYGTYILDFSRSVQINTSTLFERKIQSIISAGALSGVSAISDNTPIHDNTPIPHNEDYEDYEDYEDDDNDDYDNYQGPMEIEESREEEKKDILLQVEFSDLSPSDRCVLCLENFSHGDNIVIPMNCNGHYFHRLCPSMNTGILDYIHKTKQCPACKKRYGTMCGNMPHGTMSIDVLEMALPGYEKDMTIQITFDFPSGIQGDEHPNPGLRYESDRRVAYLPDCVEGRHVLSMIQKAWRRRLLFTIGPSVTRGIDGCIIYNGIHFKTIPYATSQDPWGFPDPTYLLRVTQELHEKGVY